MTVQSLQAAFCAAFAKRLRGERAPVPYGTEPLWEIFAHLSGSRQYGPHGPQPLGIDQFEAWGRISGVSLRPHHIAFLQAADQVWLAAMSERMAEASSTARPSRVSRMGITPALFDGIGFGEGAA